MKIQVAKTDKYIEVLSFADDYEIISRCKINYNQKVWSISEWFTASKYQHQGNGFMVLRYALHSLRITEVLPRQIYYIWNGQNEYVHEWFNKRFSPMCLLPIEYQMGAEDDWRAHIYNLDKDKFLEYFGVT